MCEVVKAGKVVDHRPSHHIFGAGKGFCGRVFSDDLLRNRVELRADRRQCLPEVLPRWYSCWSGSREARRTSCRSAIFTPSIA